MGGFQIADARPHFDEFAIVWLLCSGSGQSGITRRTHPGGDQMTWGVAANAAWV